MSEKNNLKATNSSFSLVGKAIVNDKTFTLDSVNEAKTWQYSHVSMGIDCGEKYGTIFIERMGGHDLTSRGSVKYCSTKNEDGTIKKGKENQVSVTWEDRFNQDFDVISDLNLCKAGFRNAEGKIEPQTFVFEEDFIKYIAENVKDGDIVSVRGHLEYYRDPQTGDVSVKKVVDNFFASNLKEDAFKATFEIGAYVDGSTMGKINKEEAVMPLFIKVASFVGKLDGKKYNQNGCYALKLVWDLKNYNLDDAAHQKTIANQCAKFFKPDKGMVNKIVVGGYFIEGAGITEVKPEDFSKEIQEALASGLLSIEELTGTALSGKNRTREMYFKTVTTFLDKKDNPEGVVKFNLEKNICREEDLIFVQDLKPIEDNGSENISSVVNDVVEAESDEEMDDMMAALFGDLN